MDPDLHPAVRVGVNGVSHLARSTACEPPSLAACSTQGTAAICLIGASGSVAFDSGECDSERPLHAEVSQKRRSGIGGWIEAPSRRADERGTLGQGALESDVEE